MKKIKFLVGLFVCLLFVSNAFGQTYGAGVTSDEEQAERNKLYKKVDKQISRQGAILKGWRDVITTLERDYCSATTPNDIVPESWHPDATSIVWRVYTSSGGVETDHPTWFSTSGTGQDTKLHFLPAMVESSYHGLPIVVSYVQKDGLGNVQTNYDYTRVFPTPTAYTVGTDGVICSGFTYDITLSDSESGMEYTLYRDGNVVNVVPEPGTGNALTFVVNQAGVYTMKGFNPSGTSSCEADMLGSATLTVHNLPSPVATNTSPVCEGGSFQLEETVGGFTDYTWTAPDGTTYNGQTVTIDPAQLTDAGTYTLEVSDANTCVNTVTTDVVVNETPDITADNDGPICVGNDLTLSSTVNGGTGPYTYSWTKVPDATVISADPTFTINTVALTDAGEYQLVVTDANLCATAVASTIVVVNDNPTVSLPIGPTNVCEGQPLTLTAAPAGGSGTYTTFTWYHNGTLIAGQTGMTLTVDPTVVANSGAYTVVVEDNSGCISAESAPSMVVVIPFFSPIISNDSPKCVGEDVQLTCANPYDDYSWTDPSNTVFSTIQNPVLSAVTLADAGIYTLTAIDGFGCVGSATTEVFVNDNPIVAPSYNAPVCVGGVLTIAANASGGSTVFDTYAWTKDGLPYGGNTATIDINPADVTDNGTYGVTVIDNNGCSSAEVTVVVTVQPLPIPTINTNPLPSITEICDGQDFTLTGGGGSAGATYSWLLPDGSVQVGAVLNVVAADKATYEGAYELTVTEGTCVETLAHTVTIHSNPTAAASNGGDVCLGDDISLLGLPGAMTTYTWTDASAAVVGNLQDVTVSSTAYGVGNHTFTLTVIDGNGCSDVATTSLDVRDVQPILNASSGITVCENEKVTFTASDALDNGTDTYSYEFFVNTLSQGIQGDANPTIEITVTQDIDVYVIITNTTTGCDKQSAQTSITMNPIPLVAITAPLATEEFCADEAFTIEATAGFDRYVFYKGPSGSASILYDGPLNSFNVAAGFSATEVIAVEAFYNTGCSAFSSIQTITINSRPIPTIVTGNLTVCANATETYTTESGTGESNWQWSVTGGTIIGVDNDFTVDVIWDGAAPHTITFNYDNSNGCGAATPSTENITVNPLPIPNITGPSVACNGTTQTYTTPDVGMSNYKWTVSAGGTIVGVDNAESVDITWNTFGTQTVSLSYTDTNLCDASAPSDYSVDVLTLPAPIITGDDVVCTTHTYTYSTQPGNNNYDWQIVGGTILSDPLLHTIEVEWTSTVGTEQLSVNFDVAGCPASAPDVLPVIVSVAPTVSFTGALNVCANATEIYEANVTGLGAGNYTWLVQGGSVGITDDESISVVWDGAAPHSVSLNYVNASGCDAVNPTVEVVTVNTVVAGLTASATTICSGTDVTFTATGGDTYEFYIDNVLQVVPDPTINIFVASGLTDAQVVTVKAIDAIGCEDTHAGITITVNETPNPNITSGPASVCLNEVSNYVAEGGYVNYDWTVVGGNITSDPNLSNVDVEWTVEGAGSISVVYESVAGCVGAEFTLPVTVNDLPTVTTYDATPSNNVIKGTDITLTATGGVEYAFFKISGGVSTELQAKSAVDNIVVSTEGPSANPVLVHNDIVRVLIYNAADCSVSREITIGIYEGINPFNVIASEPGHCFGESISSISIDGFQPDITYELFQIGSPDVSLGKVLASAGTATVKWDNIVGANPAAEFKVVAYYDGTPPTPPVDMNNTVFVEEYADLGIYDMSPTTAVDGAGTCGTTTEITLSNSEVDVNYQLLNGATVVAIEPGTGALINFGAPTSVGTFSIRAVHASTGCSKVMTGSWDVQGDPAINTTFIVEGSKDGKYCDDGSDVVTISLSGSQLGYNYELYYNNAPLATPVIVAGTDAAINFGTFTTEGDYSVILESSGCTYYMTGIVEVELVSMPIKYTLTASDNGYYCDGAVDGVMLEINDQHEGIDYYVVKGSTILTESEVDNIPLPISGNISGGALSLGRYLQEDSYLVNAVVAGVGCITPTDAVTIAVVASPMTVTLLGDNSFCEGSSTNLYINNPQTDVDYVLFKDGIDAGIPGIPDATPASRIDWSVTEGGDYTIVATTNNPIACGPTESAVVTVTMQALAADKTVNVTDGVDCANGTVFEVVAPDAGVTYYVKNADTDTKLGGTGFEVISDGTDPLTFPGIADSNGNYTVVAENGGCPKDIFGPYNISIAGVVAKKALIYPDAICEGDGGVMLGVINPDVDVVYELYVEGNTDALQTVSPPYSDDPIFFTMPVVNEGVYYVMGVESADPIGGCRNDMGEHITIKFNPLPTAFKLEASGIICVDKADPNNILNSASITVSGSQVDYTYALVYTDVDGNKSIVDNWVGDGSKFTFSDINVTGDYTVYAKSPNDCTSSMEGVVIVTSRDGVSEQLTTSNTYAYCAGDGGAEVILSSQEFDVIYEVRDDSGNPLSPPVTRVGDSSGSQLSFGLLPVGSYTIYGYLAGGGCELQLNALNNVQVISEPEVPTFSVLNENYCFGGDGATVTVTNAIDNVGYMLLNEAGDVVSFVNGTAGGTVVFPSNATTPTTENFYVKAVSYTTGCESVSAPISITQYDELEYFNIMVNTTIINEDEIGAASVNVDLLGLTNSTVGVTYSLLKEGVPLIPSNEMLGTGDKLDFGIQTEGGYYTVSASQYGCSRLMAGTVRMEIKPLVAIDSLVAVPNGDNELTVIVHENDDLERTVLDLVEPIPGANIKFSLVNPEVNPNPDPRLAEFEFIGDMESTVGNKYTINELTGELLFVKRPSFYGRDSINYLIYNTEHTHRYDQATVYFFVGNADVDEDNNLLIPNAFSPNGDNINDSFVISGSYGDGPESVSESKIEVFNRWGTVVYRSKGAVYGKDEAWWDGTSNSGAMVTLGEKLPSGTYFYVYTITINDSESGTQTKDFSGFIELRR
ncbi:gliding motility-associated C-terminal domain-containing protein [Carboxylicivirga sp. M1479]|uniref:T9SS type B sorting domain-containing protein n=1 Tax=Carboxylicivirga sp. M1479 TaxID=2594476 RepID=UPI0011774A10|nr:gliding motility-associated C-terminal domain-containing protein [Carboxylicivirga sp. M1479]TRX70330.1 T9SS type B sorting domain-containing protein [Carboxylicivirga sp. M1479]